MSDWWTERRQNQQLSDLQSEMSYARSEASSLRSQLSRIQGSLQSRVESMSRAFDAFVELSDLRQETVGFIDAAELRRYAARVLSAMASGTELPAAGRPVPQYWLEPAVVALISLYSGTPDEEAVSTAIKLDERRTSTFLALALAALGQRHQVRTEWIDAAFGVPADDGTLTRVQRVLWTTAARGGFSAESLDLVVQRLQTAVSADGAWLTRLESRGSAGSRPRGLKATETQDAAWLRLSRVRDAVDSIVGNTEAREPDPSLNLRAAVPADVPAEVRADVPVEPEKNSAAALLRLLISEGSEPERGTLARIAVLRARVTGSSDAVETLSDSAGKVDALLADDLAMAAEPHLAATALRVISPSVLPAVESLAHIADQPAPSEVSVDSGSRRITIRPDGPDQLELGTATSAITSRVAGATAKQQVTPIGFLGAGVLVALGLGLLLHWFWILVGLALIGIGLNSYFKLRSSMKADRDRAAGEVTNLNDRCTTAATALTDYTKNTASRRAAITSDLTAIRDHLTA
ncbi:hypothetical protein JOF29_002189 [Kribbella aluminosa]|uniref:Uncharacterized protein n=1 Tax=Kribbella aluminosa TaxID=416017 RepID=A0ABS4UHI2_9ACTN|nr:hypothetical protein [Kribbella aluminosa]MBP2351106.1 hypothetical protein [Kribbella aluminosa]